MEFKDTVIAREKIEIKVRRYNSFLNIQSAAILCRLANEVEKNNFGVKQYNDIYAEHQTYIINSISSSVAFLESTINEQLADIVNNEFSEIGKCSLFNKEDISILREYQWKYDKCSEIFNKYRIDKNFTQKGTPNTLYKYQVALCMAKKEIFSESNDLYLDAKYLIYLRNELTHYEPEWVIVGIIDDAIDTNTQYENYHTKRVKELVKHISRKVVVNPFIREQSPSFPDTYLSHGCAVWALNTCLKFTDEFYQRLSIKPEYNQLRDKLSTV
jgi:hypothetical protein